MSTRLDDGILHVHASACCVHASACCVLASACCVLASACGVLASACGDGILHTGARRSGIDTRVAKP
jgi:hypothetical protein